MAAWPRRKVAGHWPQTPPYLGSANQHERTTSGHMCFSSGGGGKAAWPRVRGWRTPAARRLPGLPCCAWLAACAGRAGGYPVFRVVAVPSSLLLPAPMLLPALHGPPLHGTPCHAGRHEHHSGHLTSRLERPCLQGTAESRYCQTQGWAVSARILICLSPPLPLAAALERG